MMVMQLFPMNPFVFKSRNISSSPHLMENTSKAIRNHIFGLRGAIGSLSKFTIQDILKVCLDAQLVLQPIPNVSNKRAIEEKMSGSFLWTMQKEMERLLKQDYHHWELCCEKMSTQAWTEKEVCYHPMEKEDQAAVGLGFCRKL